MITHHDITYQHHSIQFVLCQVTAACIKGSVGLSKYWKIWFQKSCVHSINFLNTSIVHLVSLALSAASCRLDRYISYSWWCVLSENDFYLYLQLYALSFLKCVSLVCSVSIIQEAELYTDFVLCGCRFLNLTGGKTIIYVSVRSSVASEKNMLFWKKKKENGLNWQILEACTQQKFGHRKIFVFSTSCRGAFTLRSVVFLWFN